MIDFIPLESYYGVFLNGMLIVLVLLLINSVMLPITNHKNIVFSNFIGCFVVVAIILFLGFRPVSGVYFGDMATYAVYFQRYSQGADILIDKDIFFHVFMKFCASIMNIHFFFTVCVFLYVFPLYKISRTYFDQFWFYAFFMFAISFSFYTYGTNGIRNGISTSVFLWGLCYKDKKIIMALFFVLSVSFHNTMLLPIAAFLMTYLYNDPKKYFIGWIACIPLSLALGGLWISLFSNLGFADDRLSGYLSGEMETGKFASTGFRWDFLFHSAFAVFAGWFFILKKGFKDKFYHQLVNTYLICNGFWILVIKANFSNRFAYLSWFMMALIIIYPFLKAAFFKQHHLILGRVLVIYFSFTYLMYYIYN